MDNICRLCRTKSSKMKNIFTFEHERLLLDSIILFCPIRVEPFDDLPKNVCMKCIKVIKDAHELREISIKSDIEFRKRKKKSEFQKIDCDPFDNDADESEDAKIKSESDDESEDNDSEDENSNSSDNFVTLSKLTSPKKRKKSQQGASQDFSCPKCSSTFSFSTNLSRHMRLVHDMKGVKTKFKNNLKKKMKNGSDDKNVRNDARTCQVCGKYFSYGTNYFRHLKAFHPGVTPHSLKEDRKIPPSIAEDSKGLTEKYFGSPNKRKLMKHYSVVFEDSEFFSYKCLLCDKDKFFKQSITNEHSSNAKRHLKVYHEKEFRKFENGEDSEDNDKSMESEDDLPLKKSSKDDSLSQALLQLPINA